MRTLRITALVLLVAAPGLFSQGSAHERAVGIVKERMDAMETMSKVMKSIRQHIEANRNLAAIAGEANGLRETASHIPSWFPSGSDATPTEASPAIWQRWPDFQMNAARLEQESTKLATIAASGDPKAIAAQFLATSQTCATCHEVFRAKR